jgi:putative ABC transport system substrate-binding protein
MKRRIALSGVAVLACGPVITIAQPAAPPRLGILFTRPKTSRDLQAFLAELRRLGYEDGRTLRIEYLEGEASRVSEMAHELVSRKVDVIFAPNTASAVAARKETSTVPIVFGSAHDPVHAGLVQSLAKPGGNVTGLTVFSSELPAKRLQLFTELVPRLNRIAVLRSPLNSQTAPAWDSLAAAAKSVGVSLQPFEAAAGSDVPGAFQSMKQAGLQAMLIHDDAFTGSQWKQIAALGIEHRIASNSTWDEAAELGVLFSYGPSLVGNYTRAASYIDAILKGARPADLPVQQPSKFKLALNTKTAVAIKLPVPDAFKMNVDHFIEA